MHIFWKWKALGSVSIGDQQINIVLENYWSKIGLFHYLPNYQNCQSTDQQVLDPYTYLENGKP